jgi:hypothetical protein
LDNAGKPRENAKRRQHNLGRLVTKLHNLPRLAVNYPDRVIKSFRPAAKTELIERHNTIPRGVQIMRMPKLVKETKTVAISVDAFEEAITRRLMATMEDFMAADLADEIPAELIQRAA